MPSEIMIPFYIGEDGHVATVSDPDTQVRQHVLSLVNTQWTERLMQPSYGVNSQSLLFENETVEITTLELSTMIRSGFSTWEPGVTLLEVSPALNSADNITQVDVLYERNDAADTFSTATSVNTAIIGADGTVKEIIRG